MKAQLPSEVVRVGFGILLICLACGYGFLMSGCGRPDVPTPIPPGHHAECVDYQWFVHVDPVDENWKYYTDEKPVLVSEGDEPVVCMENVRVSKYGPDRYVLGRFCVGGEGKIVIVEQGSEVVY